MKLYKILGSLGILNLIIGMASICGAIEWRTSLKCPVIILLIGIACVYASVKESGGCYEDF